MKLPDRHTRAGVALYAVPLYAGPLLAGGATQPPAVIPVLAALLLLMMVVTRRVALDSAAGALRFGALAAAQFAVVALLFAAGRGGAWLLGGLSVPLWLPLALTGAAAAFAAWRYRDTREVEGALEEALTALRDTPTPQDPSESVLDDAGLSTVQAAFDRLRALPARPDPARIDPIVEELETAMDDGAIHSLIGEAGQGDARFDLALLRYLARPSLRARLAAGGEAEVAVFLTLPSMNATVRAEAVRLAEILLEEGRAEALPETEWFETQGRADPGLAPLARRVAKARRRATD